jgi:hypothetical protein
MKSNTINEKCSNCGCEASSYDGVYLQDEYSNKFLCSKCYNESISELFGFKFNHLAFHPIDMADTDGVEHNFHFQTRLFGENVAIRALEIKKGEPRGYEFSIHGDVQDDLFQLFGKLVEHIRRELHRKHIEPGDFTRYSITDEDTVRGRIAWDDETGGMLPCLVIDGKELSWEEFGRMLMTYEGFHFKLEIFEGHEKV